MSEIDSSLNAFPRPEISGYVRVGDNEAELWERQKSGMSMREWYAGMALQGYRSWTGSNVYSSDVVSEWAYKDADSMIRIEKRIRGGQDGK